MIIFCVPPVEGGRARVVVCRRWELYRPCSAEHVMMDREWELGGFFSSPGDCFRNARSVARPPRSLTT